MLPTQQSWYVAKRIGRSYVIFVATDTGALHFIRAYAKLADAARDFPSARYTPKS